LLTCGALTPDGEFLELPQLDLERLQAAWQEAVFALYLAEDKIEPEVVENMLSATPTSNRGSSPSSTYTEPSRHFTSAPAIGSWKGKKTSRPCSTSSTRRSRSSFEGIGILPRRSSKQTATLPSSSLPDQHW
jgi:hypothetical protein